MKWLQFARDRDGGRQERQESRSRIRNAERVEIKRSNAPGDADVSRYIHQDSDSSGDHE